MAPEIEIPESVAVGFSLTKVSATDDDYDISNRKIQYSILSGSEGKITIDSLTVSVYQVCGGLWYFRDKYHDIVTITYLPRYFVEM